MTFTITQLYMNNVVRYRMNKLHIHKIEFLLKYQCPLTIRRKNHIQK